MSGQADDLAPVTIDDVAALLQEHPEADRDPDADEDLPTDDDAPEEDGDSDESETNEPEPEDAEGDESEAEPTSGKKFTVTIKGENGEDITQSVDEKELIAGYTRHADYTRKTQALARREEQAVEIVHAEIGKAQKHYIEQAQMAHALVARLAGIRSPEEMAQLAQIDPAGYVAEQARMQQIQSVIGNLQQQWQGEQARSKQNQEKAQSEAFAKCWSVLHEKGIDRPKLQNIFDRVEKDFGIDKSRFAGVSDPAVVLVMEAAVKYRDLMSKKAEVTKKATVAPRLPQKQSVPRNDSAAAKRDGRLRTGRGSRGDLASFIAQHNL